MTRKTVADQSTAIAQIYETLLLLARRQPASDRIPQETIRIQQESAQQISANTPAMTALRATIQNSYGSNGQHPN